MAPNRKGSQLEENIEEIPKSLSFMSGEPCHVEKQQPELADVMNEVK